MTIFLAEDEALKATLSATPKTSDKKTMFDSSGFSAYVVTPCRRHGMFLHWPLPGMIFLVKCNMELKSTHLANVVFVLSIYYALAIIQSHGRLSDLEKC